MKRHILLPCLLLICPAMSVAADPFYLKLFQEGKELFAMKKYAEALDNFRVAEFGLAGEKAALRDLYFYSALAFFRMQKPEEARRVLGKFATDLGTQDIAGLPRPPEIERDLAVMLTALEMDREAAPARKPQSGEEKKESATAATEAAAFTERFSRVWDLIVSNKPEEAEAGIKSLRSMDKGSPLVFFLQGLLSYQRRDFSDAVSRLEKAVSGSMSTDVRQNALYYLCLSLNQVDKPGQFLYYYSQAGEMAQAKLKEIHAKISAARDAAIDRIAKAFERREFSRMREKYEGDSSLCSDFLACVVDNYQYNAKYIFDIIAECLRHPDNYNRNFVLLAVTYLRGRSDFAAALDVIQKSRFAGNKDAENLPLRMALGELYYDLKKYKKALSLFEEIKADTGSTDELERWLEKVRSEKDK